MAVHAATRKQNPTFATLHHAFFMRREIRKLCEREFGYKFKPRNTEMPEQEERRRRYERRELDKEIDFVTEVLRSITMHINLANAIYPQIWAEYAERRLHQTLAIAECSRLSAELQFAIEDFGTDVNQFIPIDSLIQKQIKLLKGWRQSDNRMANKLRDTPAKE